MPPLVFSTATQVITFTAGEARALTIDMQPPQSIVGWTLVFTLWKPTNAALSVRKSEALGGLSLTDPAGGEFTVTLDAADTQTLSSSPGLYVWEAKRTDAGYEGVVAGGTVHLMPGVA